MAKGKYAARAANKRASDEAATTEDAYKRKIVELTKELRKARQERDEAVAGWAKELRILRAQLSEATSPRVEALARRNNELKEQLDEARRDAQKTRRRWGVSFDRMIGHFQSEHGMSRVDAVELMMKIGTAPDEEIPGGWDTTPKNFQRQHGTGAVVAIQKARGERR